MYYGTITIEQEDGGLALYFGPAEMKYIITPYDGDTFYETFTGTGVYFTFGSDGKVQSVNVTMLDLPGRTGVYTRV